METYRLHSVWLLFLLLPKLPVPLPILPMVRLRCDAKRATAPSRAGFWWLAANKLENTRVWGGRQSANSLELEITRVWLTIYK